MHLRLAIASEQLRSPTTICWEKGGVFDRLLYFIYFTLFNLLELGISTGSSIKKSSSEKTNRLKCVNINTQSSTLKKPIPLLSVCILLKTTERETFSVLLVLC